MNIVDLLSEMEDEYEVILNPVEKSSMSLLKFVRKEFGYTPLEVKDFFKQKRVIYTELKFAEAKERVRVLRELGADVTVHKTGDNYLKYYDPQEVERTLVDNIKGVQITDYYTTPTGGILLERNGQTAFYLIEDDNLSKACRKYLLEKGLFRENLRETSKPAEVVEVEVEVEN